VLRGLPAIPVRAIDAVDLAAVAVRIGDWQRMLPTLNAGRTLMKLIYAVLMRGRQGWRNIIVTPFESKQI
jgi:hypothetical protein